ncbi:MAG TPA: PAS domain S-box protein [Bryobacteraceae bacterium]|nr:PAS domain S-box protein [Bryobacteraceae bacterium]
MNKNHLTDRKLAQEALEDVEEQWRAALESNPTMYFIVDAAGKIVTVNPFGADQLGYSVGELLGRSVLDVFVEADRGRVRKHAQDCFEQPERTMRWEARKIRKDGTMLWVRETAKAVLLKTRAVLLIVCEDITEQKQAEEAARRSERELRDLVENVPAMVFIALPGPSNAFVSRGWREFTGLSAEDTAGVGWQRVVHPEDLGRHMDKWCVSSKTGEPFEDEARFRRAADGEYRWFLVRAVPLRDETGSILKWYGVLTDIEDRKRAEQALVRSEAYLAESQKFTHTGSWAVKVDARTAGYWSEENYRIWGFDPQGGTPEREKLLQRVHPEDRERVFKHVQQATREGTEYSVEYRIVLPDGTLRHIHGLGHPVFDANGEVVEVIGTNVDVTERKHAEEERQRLNRELEQRIKERTAQLAEANRQLAERNQELARVSRMKSEFLTRISHELRTPLNSIAGFTDLLGEESEGPLGEVYSDYVRHVKKGAHHLIALVNEILDLSRIEAGRVELRYEEFPAAEAITQVLSVTRALAEAKQIDVRNKVPSTLLVYADRTRFEQVFYNLVSNAVKFTPPAGQVRISSDAGEQDVRFLVSDTGIGIPKEEHAAIFEEFHQVGAPMTGVRDGAGLGLAITKRIVELHGGRIWVESAPGEGSRFFFTMLAGHAEAAGRDPW